MKVFNKLTVAQIKSVRVNQDHVEQIIEWFNNENLSIEILALGIDNTYKNYDSIDSLTKSRGKMPKTVVLTAKKGDQIIQVFFSMQFCIVETINRNPEELEYKIVRLMKLSVPRLFKLFPFKWFVWLIILMFLSSITASIILKDWSILTYAIYPVSAFIIAGLYNNKVNGIHLIYSHEKTSFWTRKKDDIILAILTVLVITPFGLALWDYVIKPFINCQK